MSQNAMFGMNQSENRGCTVCLLGLLQSLAKITTHSSWALQNICFICSALSFIYFLGADPGFVGNFIETRPPSLFAIQTQSCDNLVTIMLQLYLQWCLIKFKTNKQQEFLWLAHFKRCFVLIIKQTQAADATNQINTWHDFYLKGCMKLPISIS